MALTLIGKKYAPQLDLVAMVRYFPYLHIQSVKNIA